MHQLGILVTKLVKDDVDVTIDDTNKILAQTAKVLFENPGGVHNFIRLGEKQSLLERKIKEAATRVARALKGNKAKRTYPAPSPGKVVSRKHT